MKTLITGCGGFIGSHVADFLGKDEVFGTYWDGELNDNKRNLEHLKKITNLKLIKCDIRDANGVSDIVEKTEPDVIFHLAAQSFVTVSWEEPLRTYMTNFIGTFNLLEAIRKSKTNPIILIACSSAEYGLTYPEEIPMKETNQLRPTNPYAVSKVAVDMLGLQYHQNYSMKVLRARLFPTTGPGKTNDVCSDFCKGIVEFEKGYKDSLNVGNLKTVRDITDVRDTIRAFLLLTQKGKFGDVYNICSGKGHKVEDILNILMKLSDKKIKVNNDVKKERILDDPIFIGDNSKIQKLGWEPEIPIEKTLNDIMNYWRNVL